jgi:tetratricopeptide (TPR) repeat protein
MRRLLLRTVFLFSFLVFSLGASNDIKIEEAGIALTLPDAWYPKGRILNTTTPKMDQSEPLYLAWRREPIVDKNGIAVYAGVNVTVFNVSPTSFELIPASAILLQQRGWKVKKILVPQEHGILFPNSIVFLVDYVAQNGALLKVLSMMSVNSGKFVELDISIYDTLFAEHEPELMEVAKSVRLLQRTDSKISEGSAKELEQIGNALQMAKKYDKAIEKYERALDVYASLNNTNSDKYDSVIALIYTNKGDSHKAIKQYDKALRDYEKALEITRKKALINPRDSGVVVGKLIKTGEIYGYLNNKSMEIKTYSEGVDIQRSLIRQLDTDKNASKANEFWYKYEYGGYRNVLAIMLDHLGNAYYLNRQYDEALVSYKEAISYYQIVLDVKHAPIKTSDGKNASNTNGDIARVYTNMGLVYKDAKQFENALSSYRKALAIYETLPLPLYDKNIKLVTKLIAELG